MYMLAREYVHLSANGIEVAWPQTMYMVTSDQVHRSEFRVRGADWCPVRRDLDAIQVIIYVKAEPDSNNRHMAYRG
jgi:hypothetical protein